ncbi:MAG: hypothetical protein HN842_07830 [Gammaproteobacteria bacterium]|nr:hypothetical protein [Gammaproteobacteria bacterium]
MDTKVYDYQDPKNLVDFFANPVFSSPIISKLKKDRSFRSLVDGKEKEFAAIAKERFDAMNNELEHTSFTQDEFDRLYSGWTEVFKLVHADAPAKDIATIIIARMVVRGQITYSRVKAGVFRSVTAEDIELLNIPFSRMKQVLKECAVLPSRLKQDLLLLAIEQIEGAYQSAIEECGPLPKTPSASTMPARAAGQRAGDWQLVIRDLWEFASQEGIVNKSLMVDLLPIIDVGLHPDKDNARKQLKSLSEDLESEFSWWVDI